MEEGDRSRGSPWPPARRGQGVGSQTPARAGLRPWHVRARHVRGCALLVPASRPHPRRASKQDCAHTRSHICTPNTPPRTRHAYTPRHAHTPSRTHAHTPHHTHASCTHTPSHAHALLRACHHVYTPHHAHTRHHAHTPRHTHMHSCTHTRSCTLPAKVKCMPHKCMPLGMIIFFSKRNGYFVEIHWYCWGLCECVQYMCLG